MEDTSPKEPQSPSQPDGSDMNEISSDVAQIKISASQAEEKDIKPVDTSEVMEEDDVQKVEEELVSPISDTVADDDNQTTVSDIENPETPLPDFDWADFEERYRLAMQQANGKQDKLLEEFESLVRYFGIWAEASSGYDDDRSLKRLKTRESFVQRAEGSLEHRKQHYTQVVAAFQSALALLQGV